MKINKNIFILWILSFSLFNWSCKNAPVFAAIEEEVKLKKQTVQGQISGIIKFQNDLYCANPKHVFKKKVNSLGEWEVINTPGGMCTSIATDGNSIYAAFMGHGVYKYNSSWEKITSSDKIIQIVSGNYIIGIDENKIVFKLDSSNFSKLQNGMGKDIILSGVLQGGAGKYFADKDSVYSYSITGSKVGALSGVKNIKDICKGDDDDKIFILTNSELFHYDGSSSTSLKHKVTSPWSLSYSKTKKVALIGGTQGYKEVVLSSFATLNNANVKLPGIDGVTIPNTSYNQYNNSIGKWLIRPILIIDDSEDYVIYVGVGGADPKYTGLWGFYNSKRLEWNRE